MVCLTGSGCSGRSGFLAGGPTTGQMKTTISHLQFENEQLKTEVAKLKDENRSIEDRLVQEQVHNGDLAARLDDARNLLSDRGIEADTRLGARSRGSRAADASEEEAPAGPRAIQAGRSTRKPRKPPAASIPAGDLDGLPTDPVDSSESDTISLKDRDTRPRRPSFDDDTIRPVDDDDNLRWQPVVTSEAPGTSPRR